MPKISADVIGKGLDVADSGVDNTRLVEVNKAIREHPVEIVGQKLCGYMRDMKAIV